MEVVSLHGDHLHVSAFETAFELARRSHLDVTVKGLAHRLAVWRFVWRSAIAVLFVLHIVLAQTRLGGQGG